MEKQKPFCIHSTMNKVFRWQNFCWPWLWPGINIQVLPVCHWGWRLNLTWKGFNQKTMGNENINKNYRHFVLYLMCFSTCILSMIRISLRWEKLLKPKFQQLPSWLATRKGKGYTEEEVPGLSVSDTFTLSGRCEHSTTSLGALHAAIR